MGDTSQFDQVDDFCDALACILKPPVAGNLRKLRYYTQRYGLLHGLCSLLGRRSTRFWGLVGPIVTRGYLRRWLASSGPHVVNLGGGNVLSDRWLAADVDPRSDIFVDITRPLPFPNASLDVVYSEETIEHVDEYQGQTMLRECFRILRPGGTLRITTPSFDYLSSQALQDVQKVRQLNAIFYEHGHRFIYTEHALLSALKDTGFSGILKSTYRDPKSKYGVFDSHPARFPHAAPEWSQYWEADKPPAVA